MEFAGGSVTSGGNEGDGTFPFDLVNAAFVAANNGSMVRSPCWQETNQPCVLPLLLRVTCQIVMCTPCLLGGVPLLSAGCQVSVYHPGCSVHHSRARPHLAPYVWRTADTAACLDVSQLCGF